MASPFEALSPFSFPHAAPSISSSPSPLSVIIRFSIPIPDLQLTIASPPTTTAQSLNALIRPHLPRAHAASPLRLIAAGALLPPTIPISVSLRLPPPRPLPPSSTTTTVTAQDKTLPAHSISSSSKQLPAPVYIHCAISPTSAPRLSASALAAERAPYIPSSPLPPLSQSRTSSPLPSSSAAQIVSAVGANLLPPPPPPPPPPLGFDRLHSAGFSASEVASLRAQFRAQTALAHTPDTMPDPAQLLVLEERWLEAGPRGGGGGGDQDEGDAEGEPGVLRDMLWGNVMGFFWVLGGVLWLIREEGVWSRRRQIAVVTGMLANIALGILKVTS